MTSDDFLGLPKTSYQESIENSIGILLGKYDFLGLPRTSQDFPGLPRTSQEFPGLPRTSQDFLLGIYWESIGILLGFMKIRLPRTS